MVVARTSKSTVVFPQPLYTLPIGTRNINSQSTHSWTHAFLWPPATFAARNPQFQLPHPRPSEFFTPCGRSPVVIRDPCSPPLHLLTDTDDPSSNLRVLNFSKFFFPLLIFSSCLPYQLVPIGVLLSPRIPYTLPVPRQLCIALIIYPNTLVPALTLTLAPAHVPPFVNSQFRRRSKSS